MITENKKMNEIRVMDRRQVLKTGLVGFLAATAPVLVNSRSVFAKTHDQWGVSIVQAHTGERFSGVYRVGNHYLPEAFERLSYVLRDFRTGEVFPMDPHVIDILCMVQQKFDVPSPFKILSGYRSPKTNSRLRRVSTGVAKNSFHMYGQALDINNPQVKTRHVRDVAKSLRAGGVGYYPKSSFVHIDTGNVRSW